jgi:formylmethanofuran dehydrogenase subunit E
MTDGIVYHGLKILATEYVERSHGGRGRRVATVQCQSCGHEFRGQLSYIKSGKTWCSPCHPGYAHPGA